MDLCDNTIGCCNYMRKKSVLRNKIEFSKHVTPSKKQSRNITCVSPISGYLLFMSMFADTRSTLNFSVKSTYIDLWPIVVVLGIMWIPNWYGLLLLSLDPCGWGRWVVGIFCNSQTPPFSTDVDTGHGINYPIPKLCMQTHWNSIANHTEWDIACICQQHCVVHIQYVMMLHGMNI